ncbi:hypothetical protein [Atlantibacter hermannii]|uniref:hypothetical protein n=1 Tax=Atlantibacter hermannii TaxID=565 RepID=UPI0028A6450B|nr:hypothetical protein [Atlantibacter hermannii]
MKERGMIFNGEMVRAILDGRKTQTRRIMKVQPENAELGLRRITDSSVAKEVGMYFWCLADACGVKNRSKLFSCPFGEVGDRIWVRENFYQHGQVHQPYYGEASEPEDAYFLGDRKILYPADGVALPPERQRNDCWKSRPSIHMPRWASRILLEITDVRVERLASISQEDAANEGYPANPEPYGGSMDKWLWFRQLWDSIYPEQSFSHNPWVWVIEFKRVEGGAT